MPLQLHFACPLANGVHARPASALEEVTRPFASAITLTNERTRQTANAKSVLGMVGMDIRIGDPCLLNFSGPDEREAFARISRFIEHELPRTDDLLPTIEIQTGQVQLPPMLAGASVVSGIAVVPGIGRGRALTIGAFRLPASVPRNGVTDREAEVGLIDAALSALLGRYDSRLETAAGVEAAILRAHRAIVRDPEFRQALERTVRERGATAAGAIAEAEEHFSSVLAATGSALLRERALDIRDVCMLMLTQIYGNAAGHERVHLAGDSVCVANALTPAQFLALDRRRLKGLVLGHGGTTSHTVILARSFAVPTIVGVTATDLSLDGRDVVVDAELGVLVTDVTPAVARYYEMESGRLRGREERLKQFAGREGRTSDGRRIEIAANVGTAEEAELAFANGAEGIGLFRTEMLFADREEPPSEDEQFDEYRRALVAAGGRPVIIRTLDAGGDKPIPYIRIPTEDNPFLGYRAVRLYPEFEEIIRSQVRALLRASAFGRLQLMVPMVALAEEVRWFRALLADEQRRLTHQGIAFATDVRVGAMIEVPSAAFAIDHLVSDLDFFSIGSNDLLQYFTAADRANRKVAPLYNTLNPPFLRLLKKIVDDGHRFGRWVGICGEMGGEADALPILAGLGLDEISVAAPAVGRTKADLAELSVPDCVALLDDALACRDAREVRALVRDFRQDRPAPLVDTALMVLESDARSKEEAIKQAADRLFVAGRTERPRDVEDAVWRREAAYSTGFGHGFAIPHCRTDAVSQNSLVLLRLQNPAEWGSLDDKPVAVVIMLAIRESDQATQHMKVLAALARKVMHDEFRAVLATERDPDKLAAFLRETLG